MWKHEHVNIHITLSLISMSTSFTHAPYPKMSFIRLSVPCRAVDNVLFNCFLAWIDNFSHFVISLIAFVMCACTLLIRLNILLLLGEGDAFLLLLRTTLAFTCSSHGHGWGHADKHTHMHSHTHTRTLGSCGVNASGVKSLSAANACISTWYSAVCRSLTKLSWLPK